MMAPTWTKEWRPEIHALSTKYGFTKKNQSKNLQFVEKLIKTLYSHRYLDTSPQQVTSLVDGLVEKFLVHGQEEKAARVKKLVKKCHDHQYLVIRMLVELAQSPTSLELLVQSKASEEKDTQDEYEEFLTWQKEQTNKQKHEEEALKKRLQSELVAISAKDEWFSEWEEDEEEEDMEEEEDDDKDDEMGVKVHKDIEMKEESMSIKRGKEVKEPEFETEEEEHAFLIRKYFQSSTEAKPIQPPLPRVDLKDLSSFTNNRATSTNQKIGSSFPMDKPWLMAQACEKHQENAPKRTRTRKKIIPEYVIVHFVLHTLLGLETPLFIQKTNVMMTDVQDEEDLIVSLSNQSQEITLCTLSPGCLYQVLARVAKYATSLQRLRHLVNTIIISSSYEKEQTSRTLQGFTKALKEILWKFELEIAQVEIFFIKKQNDIVLPTLLSVLNHLEDMLECAMWLENQLTKCFYTSNLLLQQQQQQREKQNERLQKAEQAANLLTGLYTLLTQSYLEQVSTLDSKNKNQVDDYEEDKDNEFTAVTKWDRYLMLQQLFLNALYPYLEMIDENLFLDQYRYYYEPNGKEKESSPVTEVFFRISQEKSSSVMDTSDEQQTFKQILNLSSPVNIHLNAVPVFITSTQQQMLLECLQSQQLVHKYVPHSIKRTMRLQQQTQQEEKDNKKMLTQLFQQEMDKRNICQKKVFFPHLIQKALEKVFQFKCLQVNRQIVQLFVQEPPHVLLLSTELDFVQHCYCLRQFVLFQQEQVLSGVALGLWDQLKNISSTRSSNSSQHQMLSVEKFQQMYQQVIQQTLEDQLITKEERHLASTLFLRRRSLTTNVLFSKSTKPQMNLQWMDSFMFEFMVQEPLNVLFHGEILHLYSKVGGFLLKVKAVEQALTRFHHDLRHRTSFKMIENGGDLRMIPLYMAEMLHFIKCLLNYLCGQMTLDHWSKMRQNLQTASSLYELHDFHFKYLYELMEKCFLLEKQEKIQAFLCQTLNDVLTFVDMIDVHLKTLENKSTDHVGSEEMNTSSTSSADTNTKRPTTPGVRRRQSLIVTSQYKEQMIKEIAQSFGSYQKRVKLLVNILLTMEKHSAGSNHMSQVVTLLNFNDFYTREKVTTLPSLGSGRGSGSMSSMSTSLRWTQKAAR